MMVLKYGFITYNTWWSGIVGPSFLRLVFYQFAWQWNQHLHWENIHCNQLECINLKFHTNSPGVQGTRVVDMNPIIIRVESIPRACFESQAMKESITLCPFQVIDTCSGATPSVFRLDLVTSSVFFWKNAFKRGCYFDELYIIYT